MTADTWEARRADLERRIGEKVELERKGCGGVGKRMAELTGEVFALRKDMEVLKPRDMEGLRKIGKRWGLTFDEPRGSWKEMGRSV